MLDAISVHSNESCLVRCYWKRPDRIRNLSPVGDDEEISTSGGQNESLGVRKRSWSESKPINAIGNVRHALAVRHVGSCI